MKNKCITGVKHFLWGVVLWLVTASVTATVRGIVVGINQYPKVSNGNLDGAVNDAKDIAAALLENGVDDVVVLLDKQATRSAVVAAWQQMLQRSNAGDVLVFSFAGHGVQLPERVPGSESDRMDEVLIFTDFTVSPLNDELLVDDDIAVLLQQASDAGIYVVFLADACHSGTMTRGIDTRVRNFKVRALSRIQSLLNEAAVTNTDHTPVNIAAAAIQVEELPNVSHIGAVQDDKLAPETLIDGKSRGALSWAAAKAIRGAGDTDNDGTITDVEFANYVRDTVVSRMEGQQEPSLPTLQGTPRAIFSSKAQSYGSQRPAAIFTPPRSLPLAMAIKNSKIPPQQLITQLTNVRLANNTPAILLWDTSRGEILGTLGDVVANVHIRHGRNAPEPCPVAAETRSFARRDTRNNAPGNNTPTKPAPLTAAAKRIVTKQCSSTKDDLVEEIPRVQRVVDKWTVVETLRPYAERQPMTITMTPGDRIFHDKEPVSLTIAGQRYPYFTLFNLGSDGTINFLYPLSNLKDPLEITQDQPYKLDLTVQPPFGADHFIALTSAVPLTRLHAVLARLNGSQSATELLEILNTTLTTSNVQIGMRGVYTGGTQR